MKTKLESQLFADVKMSFFSKLICTMNILIRIWIQQSNEDPGPAFLKIFYAFFVACS
jgi:hypothetical protein